MIRTNTQKKISFLSIALGSLIVTSLRTGNAEAAWSGPRCKTQCSKTVVGNNTKKLNECATNCDNATILDTLAPNCAKLDPKHKESVKNILIAELNTKKKDQAIIETEMEHLKVQEKGLTKSMIKKRQDQLKALNKKQDKLIPDINALPRKIEQCGGTVETPETPESDLPSGEETKAPPRPKSGPHLSRPTSESPSTLPSEETKAPERPKSSPRHPRPTSKAPSSKAPPRPTSGSHLSKPPSDMPPSLPPTDMPPTIEDIHGHQAHTEPMGKSNIPTPPSTGGLTMAQAQELTKKRRAELVAEGKKPAEISKILREEAEARKSGKTPTSPQGTPSETTNNPSAQAEEMAENKPQGGAPSFLGGLGANPMAGLKKVPKEQIQDKSGVSGAGTVKGSEQPTTPGVSASSEAKPQGGAPSHLAALGNNPTARLKKFDPEAEAKRRAAAEEKLKNNPKANPSGDMFSELKKQMARRNSAMNPDQNENPHLNFEQNFDDD